MESKHSRILEIEALSTGFRHGKQLIPAVKGISFTLESNETLALVGESGSGKSVTALSVMRLLPAHTAVTDSTRMRYLSQSGNWLDLQHSGEKQLQEIRGREISMVFQEPMTSLNPVLSCGNRYRKY